MEKDGAKKINKAFKSTPTKRKITQSLMKDFSDYLLGKECGLVIKAKYFDGVVFPSTDSMRLGHYFEYMATKQLPKYGDIPEPTKVYKGTAKEDFSTDYKRANESALYFKKLIKEFEIEILSTGKTLTSGVMEGTLDILANVNGRKSIIDLKYSGLIDNLWSPMGWHEDSLAENEGHMIQAVHYSLLERLESDADVDFYFWVFNSKNPDDMRIYQVIIDDSRYDMHLRSVYETKKRITTIAKSKLWKAHPSPLKCKECPLVKNCKFKKLLPEPIKIYY
jgi:CRISPR/Cas system-associated exonuclease Cas4 (RecB family)